MTEGNLYQGNLFHAAGDQAAIFSPCRKYRYVLWRNWAAGPSFVQFIGLNPSTADEFVNDATLRRCINFAKSWGYAGMCMTNLFAFRSTDPRKMKAAVDPVGKENDRWLLEIADCADLIVVAWGINGAHRNRAEQVIKLLPQSLSCLGIGKGGDPLHPLYQPGNRIPIPFNAALVK